MARWESRTVLVTGCGGFLGGWVASALARTGARVLGLVHRAPPRFPRRRRRHAGAG